MNGHIWEALDFMMVCAIFRYAWPCPQCRVFWIIQAIQMMEVVVIIASPGWAAWSVLDEANILLEIIAIGYACHFKWVGALMAIHVSLKLFEYARIDCEWQFLHDGEFWVRHWINRGIIVSLLAYPVSKAILRRKENNATYHRSATAN